jgi:hypothetical protein
MKQRSPIYEEALPAVDDALALPPGLFKKPSQKAARFLSCCPNHHFLVLFNLTTDVLAVSAATVAKQLYDPTPD